MEEKAQILSTREQNLLLLSLIVPLHLLNNNHL
jgi:hypothetical protein